MAIFKEPTFDPKREKDHAQARMAGHGSRHNLSATAYLVPLVGALFAIALAAYALTRPSVVELLRRETPPQEFEVDLQ